jgi:hypothetical protein
MPYEHVPRLMSATLPSRDSVKSASSQPRLGIATSDPVASPAGASVEANASIVLLFAVNVALMPTLSSTPCSETS